ncbi:UDP-N-acetylglucosamine 2-epimerase [Sphingomonas sp. KC8]|nr:UDP-N-acetylglucosamine 2-epimerase [Sphingomonas sp. KC8]
MVSAFSLAVDHNLGLLTAGQSIEALETRIALALPPLIDKLRPDMVIVQGDTTSAWAAALAAHRHGVPVGHVEAGLRSHDMTCPFPEERNRVAIDTLSTLLFAPTDDASRNLITEPAVTGRIVVTGNTGIDALLAMRDRVRDWRLHDGGTRLILATCHRRENIGPGIASICAALRQLARRPDVQIALPLHPNPDVQTGVKQALSDVERITLLPSLSYPEMVRLMDRAHLILSDSGGLQEEAPALGIPLLVLRDNTERPEALATGNITLVGTDTDNIVAAATRLLDDPVAHAAMSHPAYPYGQGDAAERILNAIEDWFGLRPRPSPGLAERTISYRMPAPQA